MRELLLLSHFICEQIDMLANQVICLKSYSYEVWESEFRARIQTQASTLVYQLGSPEKQDQLDDDRWKDR